MEHMQEQSQAVNGSYVSELKNELDNLDASYSHSRKLLVQEMEKANNTDSVKKFTARWIDVTSTKPIKLQEKVMIPVQEHPKYNFVGTLLGPKGSTLKRLQEETGTKMAILGRGSVRDKAKEEEQRKEGGKYAHLNEDLHVMVEAFGPTGQAYGRIGHALAELRKFLVPELNTDIRQHQFDQLVDMGQLTSRGGGRGGARGGRGGMGSSGESRLGGVPFGSDRGRGRGAARGAPRGRGGPPSSRGAPSARGGMPPRRDPYAEEPVYRDDFEAPRSAYDTGYSDRGYEQEYDQGYGTASDTKYFDYGHGSTGGAPARDPYGGYEDAGYGDSWSSGMGRSAGGAMKPASRGMGVRAQAHPYGGGGARY